MHVRVCVCVCCAMLISALSNCFNNKFISHLRICRVSYVVWLVNGVDLLTVSLKYVNIVVTMCWDFKRYQK